MTHIGDVARPFLNKAYAAGMNRYNSGKINPLQEVAALDALQRDFEESLAAYAENPFLLEDIAHEMWLDPPQTERAANEWLWKAVNRVREQGGIS